MASASKGTLEAFLSYLDEIRKDSLDTDIYNVLWTSIKKYKESVPQVHVLKINECFQLARGKFEKDGLSTGGLLFFLASFVSILEHIPNLVEWRTDLMVGVGEALLSHDSPAEIRLQFLDIAKHCAETQSMRMLDILLGLSRDHRWLVRLSALESVASYAGGEYDAKVLQAIARALEETSHKDLVNKAVLIMDGYFKRLGGSHASSHDFREACLRLLARAHDGNAAALDLWASAKNARGAEMGAWVASALKEKDVADYVKAGGLALSGGIGTLDDLLEGMLLKWRAHSAEVESALTTMPIVDETTVESWVTRSCGDGAEAPEEAVVAVAAGLARRAADLNSINRPAVERCIESLLAPSSWLHPPAVFVSLERDAEFNKDSIPHWERAAKVYTESVAPRILTLLKDIVCAWVKVVRRGPSSQRLMDRIIVAVSAFLVDHTPRGGKWAQNIACRNIASAILDILGVMEQVECGAELLGVRLRPLLKVQSVEQCTDALGDSLPLVFTLVEDHQDVRFKSDAIACFRHVIEHVAPSELRWHTRLIADVLGRLSAFSEVRVIRELYPLTAKFLSIAEPDCGGAMKRKTMNDRIETLHWSSDVEQRLICMESIRGLVRLMGPGVAMCTKRLMPVLYQCLADGHDSIRISAADTLQLLLVQCWTRMELRLEEILQQLLKTYVTIEHTSRHPPALDAVIACCSMVHSLNPSSTDAFLRDIADVPIAKSFTSRLEEFTVK